MGNLQILGNIGKRTIKQEKIKEKKKLKRVSQENQKSTRYKNVLQEPCQRDKYLDFLPIKLLGTILEVDQRKT